MVLMQEMRGVFDDSKEFWFGNYLIKYNASSITTLPGLGRADGNKNTFNVDDVGYANAWTNMSESCW